MVAMTYRQINFEKKGRKENHPCFFRNKDGGEIKEGRTSYKRVKKKRGSTKLHLSTMIVLLVTRSLAHSWPRVDKCTLTRHAQIYAGTRDVHE